MLNRLDALHLWLSNDCQLNIQKLEPLIGDASFRKYFRIFANFPNEAPKSYIIMDAPPTQENVNEFIKINSILIKISVNVPKIIRKNLLEGFLLLEDFGDELLLNILNNNNSTLYYHEAINIILQMQNNREIRNIPKFNKEHMMNEMQLFVEWFLIKHLKLTLSAQELELIHSTFSKIANTIETHPQTFIHRDFHSRNLMVVRPEKLGVIDFQDAMIGPRTYDLVSLLKDCYILWPKNKQVSWVKYFHEHLSCKTSFAMLWNEYTLCGLQRHLKVLGIFCRIFYRDNKSRYLADLPLVWQYMTEALNELDLFPQFTSFIENKIAPSFLKSVSKC